MQTELRKILIKRYIGRMQRKKKGGGSECISHLAAARLDLKCAVHWRKTFLPLLIPSGSLSTPSGSIAVTLPLPRGPMVPFSTRPNYPLAFHSTYAVNDAGTLAGAPSKRAKFLN